MYPNEKTLQKLQDWSPTQSIPKEIKVANPKLYQLCLSYLEDRQQQCIRWNLDAKTRGGHTQFPIEEKVLSVWRQEKIDAEATFASRLEEIDTEFASAKNLHAPALRDYIDAIRGKLPLTKKVES